MSSPFATFEEFSNAKGPIYTFANNPGVITFLLILSLLITIYFFYASFFLKQEPSKKSDLASLGVLLVAGVTSLMATVLTSPHERRADVMHQSSTRHDIPVHRKAMAPLAFLGLTGLGGSVMKRSPKRRSPAKIRY